VRCNVALQRTFATPAPRKRVQFILGRGGIYQGACCGILCALAIGTCLWLTCGSPARRNMPCLLRKRRTKTKRHTNFRVPFVFLNVFRALAILFEPTSSNQIRPASFPPRPGPRRTLLGADQSPNSFWRNSRRSCASSESVAVGRAISRGMPIGSPVSSHQP
jgi:hypothetical protein